MLLRASKKYTREVSLYEPIGVDKDGEAVSLVDVIEMENKEVLEDLILDQDIQELYEAYQSCLKGQEKDVIGMRYGLFGRNHHRPDFLPVAPDSSGLPEGLGPWRT